MADEIKKLTEDVENLKQALASADGLAKELSKYTAALGENIDIKITSAKDAADVMQNLIDASLQKKELDENDKNILLNINQLLNSNLKVNGEIVELDQEHQNILKQIVKTKTEDYNWQLKSNIAAGEQLKIIGKVKTEREQISRLTREEAALALAGITMNNKLVNKVQSLVTTFSSMSAELNKMTLEGDRYAKTAMNAAENVAGVSFEESKKAMTDLIQGMSGFTRMSQSAQDELVATTAQFEKLGISTKNQAMMNELATKSFGMSARQATNFYSELVTFSKSAQVPMHEIDKNLSSIGNKLALFGRQNYQQVFKDLTVAAKDFGIEASKMLDITERFTTFEGAAQAAGRLNAVLGGNFVSGLRLMNAALEDPVDVFRQLKTAMDMSGKEFENMTNAQKRYIAEKIGVSVAEAENLFGNSLNESTQKLQERQATQKELNELSAKSTEVLQRLQIALLKIVNSPFVQAIVGWVEKIADFIEEISKGENSLGSWLGTIFGVVGALGLFAKSLAFIFGPVGSLFRIGFLLVQMIKGKTAATIADIALAPATVASENAKAASLGAHTAALRMNTLALRRNIIAQRLATAAAVSGGAGFASFGAGIASIGPYILGAVAIIFALGAAIYFVIDRFAEWNKQQAANREAQKGIIEAQTAQAKAFNQLGTSITNMTALEGNLNSFAEGIKAIAEAVDLINLEKVSALNTLGSNPFNIGMSNTEIGNIKTEVIPVKVVEIEMNQQQQSQKMTGAQEGTFGAAKEVSLKINSPVTLDGADFGRLIYNGIAIYENAKSREMTPDVSMLTNGQLLNWNRGT